MLGINIAVVSTSIIAAPQGGEVVSGDVTITSDLDNDIDTLKSCLYGQANLHEKIKVYQQEIDEKIARRKQLDYYIKVKNMPIDTCYNRLKTESKLNSIYFQNTKNINYVNLLLHGEDYNKKW